MKPKFSLNFQLPDYLEEALTPFSWSGIFSDEFRLAIVNVLMASEPVKAVKDFQSALRPLTFIDSFYKTVLVDSLFRYAEEREASRKKPKPPEREYIAEGEHK